jgi:hypothetical protein
MARWLRGAPAWQVSGGASYLQVIDVGAWDNSLMLNFPGQSNDPALSPLSRSICALDRRRDAADAVQPRRRRRPRRGPHHPSPLTRKSADPGSSAITPSDGLDEARGQTSPPAPGSGQSSWRSSRHSEIIVLHCTKE